MATEKEVLKKEMLLSRVESRSRRWPCHDIREGEGGRKEKREQRRNAAIAMQGG